MRHNLFVGQTDSNDCGFACTAMVFNYYNINYNITHLKEELNISKLGTSAYDIINTVGKYGIKATAYKDYKLSNIKSYPVIAMQLNDNNTCHFVLILKCYGNYVKIADPNLGIIKVSKNDFIKKYTGIVIVFEEKLKLIKIIMKYKSKILLLTLTSLVISLVSIISTLVLSFIFKKNNISILFAYILIFLVLNVLKEFLIYISSNMSVKFQMLIDKEITLPVLRKIINLPHEFYHHKNSGELLSKLNDLSYIKGFISEIIEKIPLNSLFILLFIIFSLFINVKITVLNLLVLYFLYFINKKFIKKNMIKTYDIQISAEQLSTKIGDVVNNILTVKNLEKENFFINTIRNKYDHFLFLNQNILKKYNNKQVLSEFLILICNLILFILMIYNKYDASKMFLVFTLENIYISSALNIINIQPLYNDYKSSYKRIEEIINKKEIDFDDKINIDSIVFNNVSYKYDKYVLKDINLSIHKKEWILVTGPSGSGKSTLFKLLTKQIKSDNKISINGIDIDDYDDVRRSITYVDQKQKLFNMSVLDNILLDNEEYKKAFKTAIVIDDIDNSTIIDNTNTNFSSGQMQMIMVAQALNNSGDVIIFDETTSQMDCVTERKILVNIKKNYPNKTIILIAHRIDNEDLFDKKIVLEDGKIKERIKMHERIN